MSLASKFAKNSKLKGSGKLSKIHAQETKYHDTGIPALNLAYSGDMINGGTRFGVTTIAGRSKSFKTLFGLISAKAYMDAYPDSHMIFYDSEGGANQEYFESVGIDPERVLYNRVMNIEELKFDMMEKLEDIKKSYNENKEYERFVFFVDSIGNLASIKEVNDAMKGNDATDMGTRAKSIKAFFRIITPYFDMYEMHAIMINHVTADVSGMGGRDIMTGGQGVMLSSNDVFVVGKRQIKEGKDIIGWQFVLNIEKSRIIRERAAIPFEVTYDGGLDKYSGLLDIALSTGHVTKPKMGWYTRPDIEDDKNWRRKDTSCKEFWEPLLNDKSFITAVKSMYCLNAGNSLMQSKLDKMLKDGEELDKETGEVLFTQSEE